MKCKYCNAEIEQDAQFCTNCGKDLSKFKRCVSCGELLDRDTEFCPYCGTKQTSEEQNLPEGMAEPLQLEEKKGSKKWMWAIIAVILLAIIGGGAYFATNGGLGSKAMAEAVDSDSIAVVDNEDDLEYSKIISFVEGMYKDFFENRNFDTENVSNLHKYLSSSVTEKLKMECPYDGGEGDFSYVIDFFRDGSLSYERPDYGDKVVSRTIEPEDNDWCLVTNIWDVIQKPIKVHLKVKKVDGEIKVVDIRTEVDSQEDSDAVSPIEEGISIEDAINVAENMIIKEGEFKGFSSEEEVNYIMLNKYGYKYEKHYFIEREWDFSPLYYKNCIFAQSIKDGDFVGYVGVPTARGEGISSFVGFDNGQMVIAPFTQSVFEDYIKQIERLGGKCIESDNSTKTYKLNSFDIVTFGDGAMGIDYCITIGRN